MAENRTFSHLIVVGSSAGGIEALTALLSTLPADFAAPIVIAQHLDPTRTSYLGDILARRSTLPVQTVIDVAPQKLEPGVVYVVPSNRDVHISDSEITINQRVDGVPGPTPSIDLLLNTAADAYGERLIAVILSGTGSDGAAGARMVKKAGGTVVIQNPETASYPGMPASLAPNTVDVIANLDRMASVLNDLLSGAEVPKLPEERRELETFLEEVRDRFDIDFNSYKTPTIVRRLQRRIVATDPETLAGYQQYLLSHPEEYNQLISAFLIKVTDFLRDPELYEYLRQHVLPDLIEYARKHGNELRIWSAGCATGEEAYSLAILFADALGNALDLFNVRIFGTDADNNAIAFARRGIYNGAALANLPEEMIARYFTKEEGNYQIKKRVRVLTIFGQHDLGQRAPFPHIDLVMCRNVLIYFTPELQQRTLQLFAYSVRNGGYLVLGKAESPGSMNDFFAPLHTLQKVYRRHGDRLLMPPARLTEPSPTPAHRLGAARRSASMPAVIPNQGKEVQRTRGLQEGAWLKMPVAITVVDRHYDIQSINSLARRYFSVHGPGIGDDLLHLAQGIPHNSLRGAIDHVLRTGAPATIDEFAIEEAATDQPRYLQMVCQPQRTEGEQGPVDMVMIVAHDVTRAVETRRMLEQQLEEARGAVDSTKSTTEARLAEREQLIQRLVDTNRQLLEANQELTSANEELRTTNEEFLLTTEEAQAATEEVETLNEELQATNEELETLNEELQATIEELNTTNDDLNARSLELQAMAQSSVAERARLDAIFASMADAVLVVDSAGHPVQTNAAYDRLFNGHGDAFTPRDIKGKSLPQRETPQQRAARGETFVLLFTLTGEDGAQRRFEASGGPVVDKDGNQQGEVVIIRDVTDRDG